MVDRLTKYESPTGRKLVEPLCRLVVQFVGVVFIYAGILKAIDPIKLVEVAKFYRLPAWTEAVFIWSITLSELGSV